MATAPRRIATTPITLPTTFRSLNRATPPSGLVIWWWSAQGGVARFSERKVVGSVIGVVAILLGAVAIYNLGAAASRQTIELPRELAFLAPIQQAGSALTIEVSNLPDKVSAADVL